MLSMHMRTGENRLEPNNGKLHRKVSIAGIARTVSISLPALKQQLTAGIYSDINLVKSNTEINPYRPTPPSGYALHNNYTKFVIFLSTDRRTYNYQRKVGCYHAVRRCL